MIKRDVLKARRKELGLSQVQVAERAKKLTGYGSQQGYRKIESGEAASSKYLAYYCQVLGLKISEVDDAVNGDIDVALEDRLDAILSLPDSEKLQAVQRILDSLNKS